MISVDQAAFGYGRKAIIENVSLSVERGEFIGIIGPNGAGKSTLFRGLLGLLPPMAGKVSRDPEITRRIGYVPQRDRLDPIYPLTAWDVVRMGAMGRLPWYQPFKGQIEDTLRACFERVGMTAFMDHPFAELSGGQRQRVLIARALATDPLLLVLDEPTAGIDPVAEENILQLLHQLNKEKTITILMVSHHLESLRKRAHRLVVVENRSVRAAQ